MVRDSLEALRPKNKIYSSAEDTLEALVTLEDELKKKIGRTYFICS